MIVGISEIVPDEFDGALLGRRRKSGGLSDLEVYQRSVSNDVGLRAMFEARTFWDMVQKE